MKFTNLHFRFLDNNNYLPLSYILLCIPELLVVFVISLFVYFFLKHFKLVTVRLWFDY